MRTPGDIWNWTRALLGVLLSYTVATSFVLHALDAPKIAFGFAGIGCIVHTGFISFVALSLYGLFTKRWSGLIASRLTLSVIVD